jgi:hypothetical protein
MVREFMKLLAPATQIGINNSPPDKKGIDTHSNHKHVPKIYIWWKKMINSFLGLNDFEISGKT